MKSPPIDSSPAASKPALRGSPYHPEHYREARIARSADPGYETWDLDPGELAWLMANQKTVLTEDLGTVSRAEGGLQVTRVREDSFAARRGLRVGDVLLDINGQELNDHYDMEELWENRGYADSKGWRLSVLRSGEPFTIDYRKAAHAREH